ncbi:hypothetical protein PMI54_004237 [Salmonella enterica]|nr:hypothetical protein [Salmonella enterica subsp. enterica serovar Larochelle]ECN0438148.1 hypothetical protein [Salmonella enterica subsp. enterica serovar Newport]EKK3318920.1 hypothetical protein [Salmonella enterica]
MECKKIFITRPDLSSTAFSSINTDNNVVQHKHNIIITGHRGYPGVMSEETLPSCQAAATSGADYPEPDLYMTKDYQLIARHNPWMNNNTNVAEVAKKPD